MKKLFTLLFALVATTALWAHDFQVDGIYYNILTDKTNEVAVTSGSSNYSGSITIPSTVTYNGTTYSVTSIGDRAFYGCSGLTSIIIPNSVTSIGDEAFGGCSSLTSIIIPNSVTSIGRYAFYYCRSLTSITIPNSVTSIGHGAFCFCESLTSIVVEKGNTVCDSRENCNAIIETATNTLIAGCQNTIIPNSVTSIRPLAFAGCTGLTSVTIGNSVTSIGFQVFYNCSGLTSIVVEKGNTVYDSRENCNAIIETATNTLIAGCQNTIIPNSVTSIGDDAFAVCTGLTSITIPNSVTSIGFQAFSGCSSLTSITIPNSVTSIGRYAFYYCRSLTFVKSLAEIPPTLGTDAFYDVSTRIPVYVACGTVSAYQSAEGWKAFTNIQESPTYSIVVDVNDSIMGTAKVDYNTCEGAQITATANYGYHFVQWSDGITDNPRTLVLTQDTTFTAEFVQLFSGQCGDDLYWAYDEANKTISITGSGDMYDNRPWGLFTNEIQTVIFPNGITHIGNDAFSDCTRLNEITIPYTVTSIGDYAFAGCRKLVHVNCYAINPPMAETTSFANYNVYLNVPCDNLQDYQLDMVFGSFKYIQCMEADSENVPTDDVTVTPGSNDVTITWPTEDDADTYSIVITKDGEVFCTLTFNSNGQLVSIAFAPGREGNHPAQYAEAAANGYRFTVTGLNEGTKYAYNLDVNDNSGKTIKSYEGEFTTESATSVDNINSQSANVQKIFRDGKLLIIRDGKTYNAQGVEL